MMETNTELLKTIRDFIRYCTTRLYSSEATFNHGYQNPEEEAAFLVLRTLRIPLEYEDKFLDAALTNNERETVLNNISRRCDDLEPTAYITKEWWLTGFPFYVDERVLIPRSTSQQSNGASPAPVVLIRNRSFSLISVRPVTRKPASVSL